MGWAKPTPVNPRNFKNPVLDDILTSVAGPISNFLLASIALVVLLALDQALPLPLGAQIIAGIPYGWSISLNRTRSLVPACLLLYELMIDQCRAGRLQSDSRASAGW